MAWDKIGTVRTGKTDNTRYIKLEKDVEIFKAGKKVVLNESRTLTLQDPVANIKRLSSKGFIDKDKAEEQIKKLESNGWLKADIFSAPTKKSGNS
jgi:hypothetical protein